MPRSKAGDILASTGYHLPDVGSTGTPSGGTTAWTGVGNIYTNNNVDATASIVVISADVDSETLRARDFDFDLDVSATAQIDGIQVRYERYQSAGGGSNAIRERDERLIKSGAYVGTDKANNGAWPSSRTLVTYGSSTDQWGTTNTASQIRSTGFGFGIRVYNDFGTKGTEAANVDYVQMQVYFSEPPSDPTNCSAVQNGSDVDVTWTDNSNNEDNFEVQVNVNSGGWTSLSTTVAANATSYTDTTGYDDGDSLQYRVRALLSAGPDSGFSTSSSITYELGAPGRGFVPRYFY